MDTHFIVAPTPTADLDIASCEVPPGDADGFHDIGRLTIQFFQR